jgi:hypothetical protein
MKSFIKIIAVVILVVALPAVTLCQKITYSDFEQEDNRDINFEIIGKMNGNVLVYKNMRWRHKINIFGDDMKIKETVKLDFIPEKTFNVDFVTYPDYFFMIYQYQKRNTLHCMAVKMDGNGKKLADPVEIDTTQIPSFSDNKIYSTVYSEDKQKVMVFKIPKRNDKYTLVTMLFNNDMKLLTNKTRVPLELDDRKDNYSNFSVDNDGNFVFTRETRAGVRDNSLYLQMAVKNMAGDTVQYRKIDLEKNYIDDVSLKIDNLNKRYILNAFYYKKNRGSIDGLFTNVWERTGDSSLVKTFTRQPSFCTG